MIFLLSLLLSISSSAGEPVFTTVFFDDQGIVYAGLKYMEKTDLKETYSKSQIAHFTYPSGPVNHLILPEEISDRNVVGILPDREKLFVLTHKSENPKDGPMVHLYLANKGWKKLGQLDSCPAFTKVKLATTKLIFFCETGLRNRKGSARVTPKHLTLAKERLYRHGTMRFPEFMLRYKGLSLILEGNAPTWHWLHLKSDEKDKERLIKAQEFFEDK